MIPMRYVLGRLIIIFAPTRIFYLRAIRPLRLLWCREIRKMFVPTMNVSIDGIVQEVLIDSVSNLMRDDFQKDDFQKLKYAGVKGNLEHCSRKLFA